MKTQNDKRPDPKPRKRPHLWQGYLFWDELVEMRKRHLLRISSIEAGKSNLDAQIEQDFMSDAQIDKLIVHAKKIMVTFGAETGPVWDWLTSIRGLGEGGLAAQLLAQIDDVGKFSNVSKLWRFCGQAVIDGKAEHNQGGEKSHYNRRLKSVCWLISDQFVKQQTSPYVEIYYAEKAKQRAIHPEKVIYKNGNGESKTMYNDGHIDNMARRKMVKIFLQNLWIFWRESEGLPTNQPYVQAILGHADIITA